MKIIFAVTQKKVEHGWVNYIENILKHSHDRLFPVDNMSFNYVFSGYQDNRPIILKLV